MKPRVTPWTRILRLATRLVAAVTRAFLLALILGAPFSTDIQIALAVGLSFSIPFAFLSEQKAIRRIEETAPAAFGPGQVRLSRPLDLDSTTRIVSAAILHLVLGFAAQYAAFVQPALARPLLLLWGLSICIAAFRHVAFFASTGQREYVVIPLDVWNEAKALYDQFQGHDKADIEAKMTAFRDAARRWSIAPRTHKFLFRLLSGSENLLVETPEED
jgi:predicted neutral ceramidase superfamily lipid hydrolase